MAVRATDSKVQNCPLNVQRGIHQSTTDVEHPKYCKVYVLCCFVCIMTFFSTTSSLPLPLVTVNKTTKRHIPQNNGLHCCQTIRNRTKAPLNLTNYQPCTQRKKSHINVSRCHMFQAVLNFHGFPSTVIFVYRLFISCRQLYLVPRA